MTIAERELLMIGFGRSSQEPAIWRAVRLARRGEQSDGDAPEPACSDALRHWRNLLARGSRRSPYRITRVVR